MTTEKYDSNQVPTRDRLDGTAAKSAPIVANGRVYVPTETTLDVYGLLP